MLGTAAEQVGRSAAMKSVSGSGCRYWAGSSRSAPYTQPMWIRPQALAWNCGTITSSRAPSTTPTPPAAAPIVWVQMERCEYTTPLGLPVVPDV